MTSTRQPKPPAVELSSGTIRRHVIWGAAITALGGLLFGYDTGVISGALLFIGKDFHGLTSFDEELLTSILLVGAVVGAQVAGRLADRIGRRNLFLIFSLGAIAIILLYTQLPLNNEILWLLGFPLGFFASGYFSGVGAFLTELYPTRLRGSGQGFCYNFGRGIGALFPFLVGALSTETSLANAIAIFAVLAYGVFFLAAFALPETRGRILHADA